MFAKFFIAKCSGYTVFVWHNSGQEAIAYANNKVNNLTGTVKCHPNCIEVLKCTHNQTDDESFNMHVEFIQP